MMEQPHCYLYAVVVMMVSLGLEMCLEERERTGCGGTATGNGHTAGCRCLNNDGAARLLPVGSRLYDSITMVREVYWSERSEGRPKHE